MLTINFYPESNKKIFIKAAKEYQEIWKQEGKKIVGVIEKISGLKFKTKIINAVTFEGTSCSIPLRLRSSYDLNNKKAVLVHELCHRLMSDNNIDTKLSGSHEEITFILHKKINLFLYDVFVDLYGNGFANKRVKKEVSYGYLPYKKAWDYTLSLTKKERAQEFKKIIG